MRWRELARFRDARVPKLDHLRRARAAGLTVPPTVWAPANEVRPGEAPRPDATWGRGPLIVRSASPTEDGLDGTAAGQFVSAVVEEPAVQPFREALARVVGSLPWTADGRRDGAVFVQPFLRPERGGVAFFDGFYYERTTAAGGNLELTAGHARGDVERGHLEPGSAWSEWLERVGRALPEILRAGRALDVEFAEQDGGRVLLQARAAPFAVRRNPTLSLANHREILGPVPSPWMVDALERAGADALGFFAEVDPAVRGWDEPYAIALGGRPWLNVAVFFRLMDRWGLPRAFVTEGIGGGPEADEAGDGASGAHGRFRLGRMLRSSPRLVALQLKNLVTALRAGHGLARLGETLRRARGLEDLFDATAQGLALALRTNFGINGALAGLVRVRRALGLRGRADVVTERMMAGYAELRRVPPEELETRLDRWLGRFGYRGPLESDLARPRFFELRPLLLDELRASRGSEAEAPPPASPSRGPLFLLDRRREWFRDELMKRWTDLRSAILAEGARLVDAGRLAAPEDVFFLTRADLVTEGSFVDLVRERRAEQRVLAALDLPDTADRDGIENVLLRAEAPSDAGAGAGAGRLGGDLRGIALSDAPFEGRVVKAHDLVELLDDVAHGRETLDHDTVLLVHALEPSWAVVFSRVGAVLTELGGELSHASILLREVRVPAIVNCRGAFDGLEHGARVRLDGRTGRVVPLAGEVPAASASR